jgi:hypothetical protein
VLTKLCTKKMGSGSNEKWVIKHGAADCAGDTDAIMAYLPVA